MAWCRVAWSEGKDHFENTLPSNWVFNGCLYWPRKNVQDAFKNRHDPGPDWKRIPGAITKLIGDQEECDVLGEYGIPTDLEDSHKENQNESVKRGIHTTDNDAETDDEETPPPPPSLKTSLGVIPYKKQAKTTINESSESSFSSPENSTPIRPLGNGNGACSPSKSKLRRIDADFQNLGPSPRTTPTVHHESKACSSSTSGRVEASKVRENPVEKSPRISNFHTGTESVRRSPRKHSPLKSRIETSPVQKSPRKRSSKSRIETSPVRKSPRKHSSKSRIETSPLPKSPRNYSSKSRIETSPVPKSPRNYSSKSRIETSPIRKSPRKLSSKSRIETSPVRKSPRKHSSKSRIDTSSVRKSPRKYAVSPTNRNAVLPTNRVAVSPTSSNADFSPTNRSAVSSSNRSSHGDLNQNQYIPINLPLSTERMQYKVFENMHEVNRKLNYIIERLDQLIGGGGGLSVERYELPYMETIEDVADLEHDLQNKEKAKSAVTALYQIGGPNAKAMCTNIVKSLMSNQLQAKYSMDGRKNKLAFSELRLFVLIKVAVLRKFKKSSRDEVRKNIMNYIKYATKRLKQKEKRSDVSDLDDFGSETD